MNGGCALLSKPSPLVKLRRAAEKLQQPVSQKLAGSPSKPSRQMMKYRAIKP